MNKFEYILISISLISLMATMGCAGGSPNSAPTATELQLEALKNSGKIWVLGNAAVTKDGFDVSSQFEGFTLKIGEFTYETTNSLASAWASSGQWEFNDNNPNSILRDDGVVIGVVLNGSSLQLNFRVDVSNTGGKISSIDGEYQFNLVSQ